MCLGRPTHVQGYVNLLATVAALRCTTLPLQNSAFKRPSNIHPNNDGHDYTWLDYTLLHDGEAAKNGHSLPRGVFFSQYNEQTPSWSPLEVSMLHLTAVCISYYHFFLAVVAVSLSASSHFLFPSRLLSHLRILSSPYHFFTEVDTMLRRFCRWSPGNVSMESMRSWSSCMSINLLTSEFPPWHLSIVPTS